MTRGENLVSRALQQNLQVRENVKRAIEADDSRGGGGHSLMRRSRLGRKRTERFFFRGQRPQHFQQIRGFENLHDKRRQLAKLQVAAGGAQDSVEPDKGAEAAAIEIGDFGELQDNVLRERCELFDFLLQVGGLVAAYDTALAANDHYIADGLALHGELHGTVKLSQYFQCDAPPLQRTIEGPVTPSIVPDSGSFRFLALNPYVAWSYPDNTFFARGSWFRSMINLRV